LNDGLFNLKTCVNMNTTYTLEKAIKRPRTRSAAARQVSNAHERDLITNQNV